MAELRLHSRPVPTVFDLLGDKEDDITYSVGWGLAQSDALAYALLGEAFDGELGPLTAVLLQQTETGTGRTDVEVQTRDAHLIVEAKRGWNMPTRTAVPQLPEALSRCSPPPQRSRSSERRKPRHAGLSECAEEDSNLHPV